MMLLSPGAFVTSLSSHISSIDCWVKVGLPCIRCRGAW